MGALGLVNPAVQSYNASKYLSKTITFGPFDISGTSSATSATTLTDGAASFVVDAYIGKTVYSNGKTGVVTTNSATVLTVASWTGGTPTAVLPYSIGAAGVLGAIGTTTCLQASADLIIRALVPYTSVQLFSATAAGTLALGLANKSATFFIAATACSAFSSNMYWVSATPEAYGILLPAGFKDIIVTTGTYVMITQAVEDITAGNMNFYVYYDPIQAGAVLS